MYVVGWLDCPAAGHEIGCLIPSKVPLGEAFNDSVLPGKRYSSRQVIHQQRVLGRKASVLSFSFTFLFCILEVSLKFKALYLCKWKLILYPDKESGIGFRILLWDIYLCFGLFLSSYLFWKLARHYGFYVYLLLVIFKHVKYRLTTHELSIVTLLKIIVLLILQESISVDLKYLSCIKPLS